MAELNISPGSNKNNSGFGKGKKHSTRVDLTPMVDLGFLLITFFVFTSTMSQPTAMNMNEPKDDSKDTTRVKASGAMTILLGKNHDVFYYYRKLDEVTAMQQIQRTDFKAIRQLILNKKNTTIPGDLMYIIKSNEDATFKDAIDLLDEMAINTIPPGHYAEADMNKTETGIIATIEQNKLK